MSVWNSSFITRALFEEESYVWLFSFLFYRFTWGGNGLVAGGICADFHQDDCSLIVIVLHFNTTLLVAAITYYIQIQIL